MRWPSQGVRNSSRTQMAHQEFRGPSAVRCLRRKFRRRWPDEDGRCGADEGDEIRRFVEAALKILMQLWLARLRTKSVRSRKVGRSQCLRCPKFGRLI